MDELDVAFAAMVVADVGLLVTFFNGRADIAATLGRSEPGAEALE